MINYQVVSWNIANFFNICSFLYEKLAVIEFLDNLTGKEMEGDSRVTFNIVILSAWMHSP